MTIFEMLHQVALLTGGEYSRAGEVGSILIHLPSGRTQRIYGRVQKFAGEDMGLLFTEVGELQEETDAVYLLELNAILRFSKVTIVEGRDVLLMAVFDLVKTSVRECAPMLQELASIADELERRIAGSDTH